MFHKNKDQIYEAWNRAVFDGKLQCWNSTPKILGPTMKREFPEIAEQSRADSRWYVTSVGERQLSTQALIVDPSFLSIFTFPFLQGDAKTALNNVSSIVITEKMAKKMFGTGQPMNKVIKIDRDNFTVTAF